MSKLALSITMLNLSSSIGEPEGGAGGAAAPPGRNNNSLGGKTLRKKQKSIITSLIYHILILSDRRLFATREDQSKNIIDLEKELIFKAINCK